ncbi:pyridoxamine 5'-phosphate oxidase family protein [Angustibacter sp. McL0619]|uniref:pyridoxamine 5'-phosphate oxidase family protein n=1 Tax=Angustibacter sp. McL0619 TaxID=3415676 RepID=UPI003CF1B2D8
MTVADPRDPLQRKQDVLYRLQHDVDLWVATASAEGTPAMVPLSFWWDGRALWLATLQGGVTGRNLARGNARVALGHTRDVVLLDVQVDVTKPDVAAYDAFAAHTGFDVRDADDYTYFRAVPTRVQAWREENELAGRWLMRDGAWLV